MGEQTGKSRNSSGKGKSLAIAALIVGGLGLVASAGSLVMEAPLYLAGGIMAFVSLVLAIVAIAIASKEVRTTAIVALVAGLLSMAASGAVLLEEWRQVHNDAAQWWDDAAQEEASAPDDL